jgi:hypothetical protein
LTLPVEDKADEQLLGRTLLAYSKINNASNDALTGHIRESRAILGHLVILQSRPLSVAAVWLQSLLTITYEI